MVQVVTVRADNWYCVTVASGHSLLPEFPSSVSPELKEKLTAISHSIAAAGLLEIHAEKHDWRQFEHAVTASGVTEQDFGTVITSSDFDFVMAKATEDVNAFLNPAPIEPPAPDL
jgi:hypothetical protein